MPRTDLVSSIVLLLLVGAMLSTSALLIVAQAMLFAVVASVAIDQFFAAIRDGDLGRVQAIVGQGVGQQAPAWRTWTVPVGGPAVGIGSQTTGLHLATLLGKADIVSWLMDHGADVNAADSTGSTPLHIACRTARESIVHRIVASGAASLNALDAEGRTPLDVAVAAYESGGLGSDDDVSAQLRRLIRALIDAGGTGHDRQRRLRTIREVATPGDLFTAIANADLELVQAVCDDNDRWVTWTDPANGNPPFQAALAAAQPGPDPKRSVIQPNRNDAREQRLIAIGRYLVVNPHTNVRRRVAYVGRHEEDAGVPPIHIVSCLPAKGSADLLRAMLGRDPSPVNDLWQGMTALDLVARAQFDAQIDRLQANVDHDAYRRLTEIRDLLRDDPHADIWASDSRVAFILSPSAFLTEQYLVQSSDRMQLVNVRLDGTGVTALLAAVMSGNCIAARLLIDAGANVSAAGAYQQGPVKHVLHEAIRTCGDDIALIGKLVSHPDIQIDRIDEHGLTPMATALSRFETAGVDRQVVDLLLGHGASRDAPDSTPYVDKFKGSSMASTIAELLSKPRPAYVRHDPRPELFEGIRIRNLERIRLICGRFPYWHSWTDDEGRSAFDIVFGHLQQPNANAERRQRWADLADLLIRVSPFPDPRSLHVAVRYGSIDLVDFVVDANPALINRVDDNGMTPLAWCSWALYWHRHAHAAQRLRSIRDTLIRHWIADIDVVSFILATDLDVTSEFLLLHRPNINAVISTVDNVTVPRLAPAGCPGYTALHMALLSRSTCNEEIALYLVGEDADLSIVDDLGRTPLDLARQVGLVSVVNRIEAKLAVDAVVDATSMSHYSRRALEVADGACVDDSKTQTAALPPGGDPAVNHGRDDVVQADAHGLVHTSMQTGHVAAGGRATTNVNAALDHGSRSQGTVTPPSQARRALTFVGQATTASLLIAGLYNRQARHPGLPVPDQRHRFMSIMPIFGIAAIAAAALGSKAIRAARQFGLTGSVPVSVSSGATKETGGTSAVLYALVVALFMI
ncbi:Ankyrin repeat domain-containing protein [Plasmodiophora brassicae]